MFQLRKPDSLMYVCKYTVVFYEYVETFMRLVLQLAISGHNYHQIYDSDFLINFAKK